MRYELKEIELERLEKAQANVMTILRGEVSHCTLDTIIEAMEYERKIALLEKELSDWE